MRFSVSVWLDFIERGFVRNGGLAALIRDDGVSGVTSNPAIFQKAIAEHAGYAEAIDSMARDGLAAHEIHEALIIEDIRDAARALLGVFERSQGRDGFVSLEVSPHFAHDGEGTYWEAKRLWALVSRPNLMIKVPGTLEGVPTIRRLIADSLARQAEEEETAKRRRSSAGQPLTGVTDSRRTAISLVAAPGRLPKSCTVVLVGQSRTNVSKSLAGIGLASR